MALDDQDIRRLGRCVELARTALNSGDEPFGSILVDADGAVLFEDHNHVAGGDATAHPELAIAQWAAANLSPDQRARATLTEYLSHDEIRLLAQQAARGLVGTVESRRGAQSASTLARDIRNNAFGFDFDLGPGEGAADLPPHAINDAIHNASRWRVTDIAQSAIDKIADWKGELLGSLTLHQLAEIAKPYLPEVGRYDDIVRQMGARRNELMGQSDPLAKKWANWQRKNKAESAALTGTMHDATLAGVDPDKPFQPGVVHLASGEAVEMPSLYDEMTERAYPGYAGGTATQRARRDLLRRRMEAEGFSVYATEWWHFDYRGWRAYAIQNVRFEDITPRP